METSDTPPCDRGSPRSRTSSEVELMETKGLRLPPVAFLPVTHFFGSGTNGNVDEPIAVAGVRGWPHCSSRTSSEVELMETL